MANIDIKNLEYKKPNEEELKEIRKNLSIHNSIGLICKKVLID